MVREREVDKEGGKEGKRGFHVKEERKRKVEEVKDWRRMKERRREEWKRRGRWISTQEWEIIAGSKLCRLTSYQDVKLSPAFDVISRFFVWNICLPFAQKLPTNSTKKRKEIKKCKRLLALLWLFSLHFSSSSPSFSPSFFSYLFVFSSFLRRKEREYVIVIFSMTVKYLSMQRMLMSVQQEVDSWMTLRQ